EIAPIRGGAFLEAAGDLPIPLLVGVLPLISGRHAEYLDNEVPGITVPDAIKDLVRVTEAAALAAARFTGRGDQDRVKSVAASAMLQALEELGMGGRVILGPRGDGILSVGSIVGVEGGFDFGVYPVEGASLVSRGVPNAISMVVAGPPGCFPSLPAVAYMEKAVVGAPARGARDLDDGVADN